MRDVAERRERTRAFMEEYIYPNEPALYADSKVRRIRRATTIRWTSSGPS